MIRPFAISFVGTLSLLAVAFALACTPGEKQAAKSAAELVCATSPLWAAKALDAGADSGDAAR